MKTVATLIVLVVIAVAASAAAEDVTEELTLVSPPGPVAPEPARTFELDLRLDGDHFRLGGRLFGPGGVAGAWLNGHVRSDGLSLDGRLQPEGRPAYNFKIDAQVGPGLMGAMWPWVLRALTK